MEGTVRSLEVRLPMWGVHLLGGVSEVGKWVRRGD